jgi:hypothetical protein
VIDRSASLRRRSKASASIRPPGCLPLDLVKLGYPALIDLVRLVEPVEARGRSSTSRHLVVLSHAASSPVANDQTQLSS